MTTDEPHRVELTGAAADLLRQLTGRYGPLMFHQSGGAATDRRRCASPTVSS